MSFIFGLSSFFFNFGIETLSECLTDSHCTIFVSLSFSLCIAPASCLFHIVLTGYSLPTVYWVSMAIVPLKYFPHKL